MVVGLTDRQWKALRRAVDPDSRLERVFDALGLDASFAHQRYEFRDLITSVFKPWFEARDSGEVDTELRSAEVTFSLYVHPEEVIKDWRLDPDLNDLWTVVQQPQLGPLLGGGFPIRRCGRTTSPARASPMQAEHTAEILRSLLQMTTRDIEELRLDGIVA